MNPLPHMSTEIHYLFFRTELGLSDSWNAGLFAFFFWESQKGRLNGMVANPVISQEDNFRCAFEAPGVLGRHTMQVWMQGTQIGVLGVSEFDFLHFFRRLICFFTKIRRFRQ